MIKRILKKPVLFVLDLINSVLAIVYIPVIRVMKFYGLQYFAVSSKLFKHWGILPIRDHYYEPQFVYDKNFKSSEIRKLPLDFKVGNQLFFLQTLKHKKELEQWPVVKQHNNDYYLSNGSFEEGDADLYYLMIRNLRPKKIIEIGSGFSTLLALQALTKNKLEGYEGELICIEPFEYSFFEETKGFTLIKERVESVEISFFNQLQQDDILFIDSSHIIRPENDVLFEYFQIMPYLKKGVIVHIHDIFSPRHYPDEWMKREFRLWNEQYLLEAFLHNNSDWEIIFSLNYLKCDYFEATKKVLYNINTATNPGSFWLKKIN